MTSFRFLATVALAVLLAAPAAADSITSQGVDVPRETEVDGERLVLFGHGVARYARIFRVYVAALYGPEDVAADDLLDSNVPRRLEITYLRNVGADDIREATRVVLEDQYSESERDALSERFERFNALYEDVTDGDQYAYEYRPDGEESRLYLNGELQGTESGEDFARAYLGIWLREDALSTSLRDDLLFGRR
ncbi:chalcone isomerase family protein [Aquisalimonas asiatica]|uniref:Chalcone isomerase-like n=1 Tax=Aquisalimonas asiatica TaxID=406100 RepID=A0A1H8TLK0_9GAMM|nr:chalcone isomerase family protein [Aquisalimonas asiatica]SEO91676.1 Chalcone isomerase-like [Aquisalimonas asiatica]